MKTWFAALAVLLPIVAFADEPTKAGPTPEMPAASTMAELGARAALRAMLEREQLLETIDRLQQALAQKPPEK